MKPWEFVSMLLNWTAGKGNTKDTLLSWSFQHSQLGRIVTSKHCIIFVIIPTSIHLKPRQSQFSGFGVVLLLKYEVFDRGISRSVVSNASSLLEDEKEKLQYILAFLTEVSVGTSIAMQFSLTQ